MIVKNKIQAHFVKIYRKLITANVLKTAQAGAWEVARPIVVIMDLDDISLL